MKIPDMDVPHDNPTVLMMLGVLSQLPPSHQEIVNACAEELRNLIDGDDLRRFAFALVCAEVAAE
jgi:hypothetical protein